MYISVFFRYLPFSLFVLGTLDPCRFCLWFVWVRKNKFHFKESIALESIFYLDTIVHILLDVFIF